MSPKTPLLDRFNRRRYDGHIPANKPKCLYVSLLTLFLGLIIITSHYFYDSSVFIMDHSYELTPDRGGKSKAKQTISPTTAPTIRPLKTPRNKKTETPLWPTVYPTFSPSIKPTEFPSSIPTKKPTKSLSKHPTSLPTKNPTVSAIMSPPTKHLRNKRNEPTFSPFTKAPTPSPTFSPTIRNPTKAPKKTALPTLSPSTMIPTRFPTLSPTLKKPTKAPRKIVPSTSSLPTNSPSAPTKKAKKTDSPTLHPTGKPTKKSQKSESPTPSPVDGGKNKQKPTTGAPTSKSSKPSKNNPTTTAADVMYDYNIEIQISFHSNNVHHIEHTFGSKFKSLLHKQGLNGEQYNYKTQINASSLGTDQDFEIEIIVFIQTNEFNDVEKIKEYSRQVQFLRDLYSVVGAAADMSVKVVYGDDVNGDSLNWVDPTKYTMLQWIVFAVAIIVILCIIVVGCIWYRKKMHSEADNSLIQENNANNERLLHERRIGRGRGTKSGQGRGRGRGGRGRARGRGRGRARSRGKGKGRGRGRGRGIRKHRENLMNQIEYKPAHPLEPPPPYNPNAKRAKKKDIESYHRIVYEPEGSVNNRIGYG